MIMGLLLDDESFILSFDLIVVLGSGFEGVDVSSSVPLFIRPPFEMERRRREQEEKRRVRRVERENKLQQNQQQYQQYNYSHEHEKENHCVNTNAYTYVGSSSVGPYSKNINDSQKNNMTMSQEDDEDIEWNDGLLFNLFLHILVDLLYTYKYN